MPDLERLASDVFLSELYANDCPDAVLLAEYPSSNSDQTRFQNQAKYIIHDPFPPPRRELLKFLGPHHLMCGWGQQVPVCSEVQPPHGLLQHWGRMLGPAAVPNWVTPNDQAKYITLFPHESLSPEQQVIDPAVNYRLHSKEVIEKIDCPQADVLKSISPPCIVKLTHGYAGLGNFFVRDESEATAVLAKIQENWNDATWVSNSIIEDIQLDFGVQFYLRKNGSAVWLGFTEQRFTDSGKWSGGVYSAAAQEKYFEPMAAMIKPVAEYLHQEGCFGVIGIDIVTTGEGKQFLVDVNPRLTGITPFLFASRMFAADGLTEGMYCASCKYDGSMTQLFKAAESETEGRVLVLSAFEEPAGNATVCHLSATADSQSNCQAILNRLLKS